MTWLIGVDEAGYGPNLGPLAIGASAWRLPDGLDAERVDLYELLSAAVSVKPASALITIADSKRLYSSGEGLGALENAVHAALGGAGARNYQALLEQLHADPGNLRRALPWHAAFNPSLPLDTTREYIEQLSGLLMYAKRRAGVGGVCLRARLVFPAELNDLIDEHGSKGGALSHVTLGMLRDLLEQLTANTELPAACCTLDKHGGRNRYGPLLQHHFPEHWVETLVESRGESCYRWGPEEGHEGQRITFAFRSGGERFLPTALASMVAKYLRELSMKALNTFWEQQVPGLKSHGRLPGRCQAV